MSYKILEKNGVDNENVDGGAFNNFAAGGRDGIVGGVLSECALAAAGSTVSISPGLIILHGIRVKVTGIETLSLSSVPIKPTSYQVVAQVTLASNGDVDFSIFIRTPQPLVQDPLYQNNVGVYQAELASFTHNTDGTISNLTKTLDIIYGSGGGSVNIEVGTVTTETLDAGLDADFDVTIRNGEGTNKILLDFDAKIPRGASGTDDQAVHFTPQGLSNSQKSQARENIGAASVAEMNAGDDKSYYNLGAYDTFTDNGDGTVTVTRKTGHYKIDGNFTANYIWYEYPNLVSVKIPNVEYETDLVASIIAVSDVWNNGNPQYDYAIEDHISLEDGNLGVRVVVKNATSMQEFRNYISQNPISVEYELQTSEQYPEKLIAKTPINTLDKNMSDIVRDEVEKTLNLFNGVWEQGTFDSEGNDVNVVSRVRSTKIQLDAGTYHISLLGADDKDIFIFNDDGTLKAETDWLEGNTFTLSESGLISITCRKSDNSNISPEDIQNVMLVKGSYPYPYQPYNGAIVHEKQLNDALENYPTNDELNTKLEDYLPLTGGTINGNINATGQVQETGQRVYSPNNPPPRNYLHAITIKPNDSSILVVSLVLPEATKINNCLQLARALDDLIENQMYPVSGIYAVGDPLVVKLPICIYAAPPSTLYNSLQLSYQDGIIGSSNASIEVTSLSNDLTIDDVVAQLN